MPAGPRPVRRTIASVALNREAESGVIQENPSCASSEEMITPMLVTGSSTTPLEASYARLNDKIDALRRHLILIEVSVAIILLIPLSNLL